MLPLHKQDPNTLVMPDITALLDVLFILLVFMLLTAAIKLDMLTVTLPTAGSEAQSIENVKKPLVLSLQFKDDKLIYGLAEQPYESLDNLFVALAEKNNINRTLVLAIDENTPSHYLINLLSKLSEKNISVANLLIDKKQ